MNVVQNFDVYCDRKSKNIVDFTAVIIIGGTWKVVPALISSANFLFQFYLERVCFGGTMNQFWHRS